MADKPPAGPEQIKHTALRVAEIATEILGGDTPRAYTAVLLAAALLAILLGKGRNSAIKDYERVWIKAKEFHRDLRKDIEENGGRI